MDRDVHGKIGFEEYGNAMLGRFEASDQDGNGILDSNEYSRWRAPVAATELGRVLAERYLGL